MNEIAREIPMGFEGRELQPYDVPISATHTGLQEIDPNLPIVKVNTIEDQLDDVLMQDRTVAALSSFFGVVAVLLACIVLYA